MNIDEPRLSHTELDMKYLNRTTVHEIWRTVQVQPLGCVRRSGIFNSFPSRSDHPAEVACLQSFSEDAQSLGRFVSLEMRL